MELTKASVAVIAAISLSAGAAGAYLVTRGGPVPSEQAALASTPALTGSPVDQSEAAVTTPTAPDLGFRQPVPVAPARPQPRRESATAAPARPAQSSPLPPAPVSTPVPVEPAPVESAAAAPEPIRTAEAPLPVVAAPAGPLYDELV